ncbi:MAG: DUF1127 domain-containing protein [Pseudomonadota bacterium]|nr:DUF1127 domain-containing protein [Pseudomonadota bacterium]MDQ2706068.1 DUF1127 domain-containing protein [Pseudomonadota bacterium]
MATIAHATDAAPAARSDAYSAARLVNAVRNFLRAWRNRREFYRLGEMSDAELSDIGLTRTDLSVAIDLPFGSDPTVRLGSLAAVRLREIEAAARQVA